MGPLQVMDDLTDYIGSAIFIAGLFGHYLVGLVYVIVKPCFKKVKVSEAEFSRIIRVMGVLAVIAGIGIVIMILPDQRSTNWFSRVFTLMLCLVIAPFLQTAGFVFFM
jgi:predicted membrane channel-forming protein YqfA (hemolysin III family)